MWSHPCPGNWMGIERVLWPDRAFSAGTKCRHCTAFKHSVISGGSTSLRYAWARACEEVASDLELGGGFRPGRALRYRGGPHLSYVFRGRRGLFWRPPHVRDFVKEGYFFVPRYEVWGLKSPYNPRNIRGSDAEWLPKYLGFRVCCRHLLPLNTQRNIESKVKIRVPVHPMSVFW